MWQARQTVDEVTKRTKRVARPASPKIGTVKPAKTRKRDENWQAVQAVERITGTGKVDGENLLGSPKLRRQLAAAKKRLKKAA